MKIIFIILIITTYCSISNCQTKAEKGYVDISKESNKGKHIDDIVVKQWVKRDIRNSFLISNSGKYFAYGIINDPIGSRSLFVEAVAKDWKKKFTNANQVLFSKDSKKLLYQSGDSLFILLLGSDSISFIPNVVSYQYPKEVKGEWLACQINNRNKQLLLINLINGREVRFDSVVKYSFNGLGTELIIENKMASYSVLQLVGLKDDKVIEVYRGEKESISDIDIDETGNQVVFAVKGVDTSGGFSEQFTYSIWYYRKGLEKAKLKVNNSNSGIGIGLAIQSNVKFSENGRYIYINLKAPMRYSVPSKNGIKVNIWNYKDSLLQSMQLLRPKRERVFQAVVKSDIDINQKVLQLEGDSETIIEKQVKGDYVIIRKDNSANIGDRFWSLPYKSTYRIVSLKESTSTELNIPPKSYFTFSPGGHYLLCYDITKEQYYSFNLLTQKKANISQNIPKGWLSLRNEFLMPYKDPIPVDAPAGWLLNDAGVLIYDNYDIWLLDLSGKMPAINITHSYGRKHNRKFRFFSPLRNGIISGDTLLMAVFDSRTKYNGFFQTSLSSKKDPQLLSMGPYTYFHWGQIGLREEFDDGMLPVKIDELNSWVVKRQSFDEAPNYYLTEDFRSYKALTELKPHKGFSWLTAELVKFKQEDGTRSQGILYKPDDFDPSKRYPLLINYYRNLSGRLYEYPEPGFTGSAFINIPWFVSRGYLVFTPDIYFTRYESGPSAHNTIVGAAKFLSKQPYIDGKHIGISGHSFGGLLTNYLVTHSNLFAAAFEGAGVSDNITMCLSLGGGGGAGLGGLADKIPFWENPQLWIKNSAIFNVHKTTTPLLMFHCKLDGAVPWGQAIQLFLALRFLNKKVWLIEYDDAGHLVYGKNAEDLTIRVTQFFDHFLKGLPAPRWMTRGVPADQKGLDYGLDLD